MSRPLRRLWQMLKMLEEAPEGLTISEMSRHLDISPRTIRRYLECAEEVLGSDFQSSKKRAEERRFKLCRQPALGILRGPTSEEKEALLIAEQVVSAIFADTSIGRAICSGVEAVCGSVPSDNRYFAQRAAARIALPIQSGTLSQRRDVLEVILTAMRHQSALRITDESNRQGIPAEVVFPYSLCRDRDGEILLLCYSCKEDAPRAVPVNRIRTARLGETRFLLPDSFDPEEHLKRARKGTEGKGAEKAGSRKRHPETEGSQMTGRAGRKTVSKRTLQKDAPQKNVRRKKAEAE